MPCGISPPLFCASVIVALKKKNVEHQQRTSHAFKNATRKRGAPSLVVCCENCKYDSLPLRWRKRRGRFNRRPPYAIALATSPFIRLIKVKAQMRSKPKESLMPHPPLWSTCWFEVRKLCCTIASTPKTRWRQTHVFVHSVPFA